MKTAQMLGCLWYFLQNGWCQRMLTLLARYSRCTNVQAIDIKLPMELNTCNLRKALCILMQWGHFVNGPGSCRPTSKPTPAAFSIAVLAAMSPRMGGAKYKKMNSSKRKDTAIAPTQNGNMMIQCTMKMMHRLYLMLCVNMCKPYVLFICLTIVMIC